MYNIRRLAVLFLLFGSAACATINTGSTLVGKWRLAETLADPGDGSGRWNRVANESYLTFNANGTVTSTEFPNYQSYAIIDSNKIEFTLRDSRKQIVSFKTEGAALILTPQCIEACGSKYIRLD